MSSLSFALVALTLLTTTNSAASAERHDRPQDPRGVDRAQSFDVEAGLESLAEARRSGSERQIERALTVLASAYLLKGDSDSVIKYGQEWLVSTRRRGDPRAEVKALPILAWGSLLGGDFERGKFFAEQALTLSRTIRSETDEISAIEILAIIAEGRMDDAAAVRWRAEALRLARRTRDRKAEAKALQRLGEAYRVQGDLAQAIASCNQSLSYSEEATVEGLACLGSSYASLQEPELAKRYLTRALRKAVQSKDLEAEGTVAGALGISSTLAGDPSQAAAWFRRGADLLLKKVAQSEDEFFLNAQIGKLFPLLAEMNLGVAEIIDKQQLRAIPHLEKAVAHLPSLEESIPKEMWSVLQAKILSLLGYCYTIEGKYEKGLLYARQQWEIARDTPRPTDRAYALHILGYALWKAGQRNDAEKMLRDAISEWEATRGDSVAVDSWVRAHTLDIQTETYDLLLQMLFEEGRKEDGLEIAERGRARTLVANLAKESAPEQSPGAKKRSPLLPRTEVIKAFATKNRLTLIEYSILYDPQGAILPSRIRGKQPHLEKTLAIWLVKPEGQVVFAQIDLQSFQSSKKIALSGLVSKLRDSIGPSLGRRGVEPIEASQPNPSEPLRQLYDLLIAPIAEHLPTDPDAQIVVIPQGPLFLVPFAALRTPEGRYLIEDHTILLAPSIDAMAAMPRRPLRAEWKADEALVVGNPTLARELTKEPYNLADLPSAGKEAAAIAGYFGSRPLVGDDAAKGATLKLFSRSRLLHLATHGLLEGFGDPLLPGALVLAPSRDDNGLLTAREIFGMNLQADLVVLSACDTGRGRITSEGVVGLSRAFVSAGVPNVVVSLWAVPDAPTAKLMQHFYAGLRERPDPGWALRHAMLATMKESPEPINWAAFSLIGGIR